MHSHLLNTRTYKTHTTENMQLNSDVTTTHACEHVISDQAHTTRNYFASRCILRGRFAAGSLALDLPHSAGSNRHP